MTSNENDEKISFTAKSLKPMPDRRMRSSKAIIYEKHIIRLSNSKKFSIQNKLFDNNSELPAGANRKMPSSSIRRKKMREPYIRTNNRNDNIKNCRFDNYQSTCKYDEESYKTTESSRPQPYTNRIKDCDQYYHSKMSGFISR